MKKQSIVFLFSISLFGMGCTNNSLKSLTAAAPMVTATPSPDTTLTLTISSVSIDTQFTNFLFDTKNATENPDNYTTIDQNCTLSSNGATSTNPCYCLFSWTETNKANGSSVSVNRSARTNLVTIQKTAVACALPSAFTNNEILDGTEIQMSIHPDTPTNPRNFSTNTYTYTKGSTTSTTGSSFTDSNGNAFINILRYTCFEQRPRGLSIISRMGTITRSTSSGTTEKRTYPIANRFCVRKYSSSGSDQTPDGCEALPPSEYSAQSYYYNLYIRESEAGDINPGNSRYYCPTVDEPLSAYTNNSSPSNSSTGQYWPKDSTFALSTSKTGDFVVGIVANSRTSGGNSAPPQPTCNSSSSSSNGNGTGPSFQTSCLGFAMSVKNDGTCPSFKDSNGNIRYTYRLRRYFALYPPVYDTSGAPLSEQQSSDTIYVLDRPVTSSSSSSSGTQPYTMLGPKPCPFAYFDRKKVADSSQASYISANDSRWVGKNIDGIQLPNTDSTTSCAAVLPLVNSAHSLVTLSTIGANNTQNQ